MNKNMFFEESILQTLEGILSGSMTGSKFVRKYDELMADKMPESLDRRVYELLDKYHTVFALYVEDPETRARRADDYFGYDELKRRAGELLVELRPLLAK